MTVGTNRVYVGIELLFWSSDAVSRGRRVLPVKLTVVSLPLRSTWEGFRSPSL